MNSSGRTVHARICVTCLGCILIAAGCTYPSVVYEISRFVPLSDSLRADVVDVNVFPRPRANAPVMDSVSARLQELFEKRYSREIAGRNTVRISADVVNVEHLRTQGSTILFDTYWRIENVSDYALEFNTKSAKMRTALQNPDWPNLRAAGFTAGEIDLKVDEYHRIVYPDENSETPDNSAVYPVFSIPARSSATVYLSFELNAINPGRMSLEFAINDAVTSEQYAYRFSLLRAGRI